MKDIILTSRRQKRELCYLLAAFVLANVCNLIAIIQYAAPITELFTSIFYVICFTIAVYALSVAIRLAAVGIRALCIRKSKNQN